MVSFPTDASNWAEPDFDALVEAWFDTVEDLDTLYFCENFRAKVDPDHVNFIDLSTARRMICQELAVV